MYEVGAMIERRVDTSPERSAFVWYALFRLSKAMKCCIM